jgi:transcriptional regulator with GAF, ATPase, and Fis domain
LSEIGYAPLEHQRKFLNVLQDLEFRPINAPGTRRVNFRIISATNVDLPSAVKQGTFQEDLYYRIAAHTFEIPPLRARPADIAFLAKWFWQRGDEADQPARAENLSGDVLLYLSRSDWAGNVRVLEQYVQKMKIVIPVGVEPTVSALESAIPVRVEHYCTGLSTLSGFNARRQHMLFYPAAREIVGTKTKAEFNRRLVERAFTEEGLAFGNTLSEATRSIDNAWEHHRAACNTCADLWARLWATTGPS